MFDRFFLEIPMCLIAFFGVLEILDVFDQDCSSPGNLACVRTGFLVLWKKVSWKIWMCSTRISILLENFYVFDQDFQSPGKFLGV